MNYLSKLVCKEWLKSLLTALLILVLLSTTAEIVNGLLTNKGGFDYIMFTYLIKLPSLMSKMFPISCLLATLFSINKLKTHSELIALLAAGFSPKKIYILILSLSALVGAVQFYNVSVFTPIANEAKLQKLNPGTVTRSRLSSGKVWYKGKNYFASFAGFDKEKNTLYNLDLFFHTPSYNGSNILKADKVTHIGGNEWNISTGKFIRSLDTKSFPFVDNVEDFKINLSEIPSDFKQFESDITTLGFINLYQYISRLKLSGINTDSYQILLLDKVSLALICIIFAMFPLATIFQPNRRNSTFGKSVIFTLVFTITFWLIYSSFIALGNKGTLSPFFATQTVPILFIAYISLIFYKHKKL
jgi:lipopolysaccharide export system permease protein